MAYSSETLSNFISRLFKKKQPEVYTFSPAKERKIYFKPRPKPDTDSDSSDEPHATSAESVDRKTQDDDEDEVDHGPIVVAAAVHRGRPDLVGLS